MLARLPGVLVCAWCLGLTGCASGETTGDSAAVKPVAAKREIGPPDVFARVGLLAAEIELVRKELGAPKDTRPPIAARGVQPRDNFYQALSVCRKTQRVCFDLTGEEGSAPASPPRADRITPGDVFAVVDAALANVRRIHRQLGIEEKCSEPTRDATKTPSDVFQSIILANRQISLLLDTRPTPTAVYEQLTDAVGTANRILARFPDTATPQEPGMERAKTPADVHGRLVACHARLREIMKRLGDSAVEVDWRLTAEQVAPGDVYDMATLLVSELQYLETRLPRFTGAPALTDFVAGRKLPSHNFQRAGLLEAQLERIGEEMEAHPEVIKDAKP